MGIAIIDSDIRSDLIRKKAYELYLKRGGSPGQDIADWLAAEKLVDAELTEGRSLPESEREISRSSRRSSSPDRVQPLSAGSRTYKRASD